MSLSSETSPLAESILGLKLRELGGIYSDLKLIVHPAVFPLRPAVCKGRFGGSCVCVLIEMEMTGILYGDISMKK